jgi:hypothetical protein
LEIGRQVQEDTDFDWFCVDPSGEIGYFTTAGFKRLPESVTRSAEDLEIVTNYFRSELGIIGTHYIDVRLQEEIPDAEIRRGRYLQGFVDMSERGLYSYDIDSYLKPNINYFRVALPSKALLVNDLPKHIQEIVGRTVLKGRLLRNSPRIAYESTVLL